MKKQRRFCLYCGGQITKKMEDDVLRDCCSVCHSYFYDNPLPVVSAIVDDATADSSGQTRPGAL